MPKVRFDDFDEFDENAEPEGFTRAPGSGASGDDPKWKDLFTSHPPGGGPFGGQDNALFKLVAFMRAKSFPIEAAHDYAQHWNRTYCEVPRLEPEWVHDKVGRAWVTWQAGGHDDATPEDATAKKKEPPARVILTMDDLLDLEENGGGMDWLVPNVFVRGGTHFVSAPAAGAKSWLMLDLARSVAGGTQWLGQFDCGQGAILYVDEEMGDTKTAKRSRQLGFGKGAPFFYLGKQGIDISKPADLKLIVDTCREKKVVLCCLDTLTGVRPGLRENESEHVSMLRAYFNAITETGCALLVAHHDRKMGQGEGHDNAHYRMAGSRDFGAMADMAYGLEKRGKFFHLSVTKNRLTAEEDEAEIDFVLEDNADKTKVTLRVIDPREKSEMALDALEDRIFDVLQRHGKMNTNTISENVKGSKTGVLAALGRMVDSNKIACEKIANAKFFYLHDVE